MTEPHPADPPSPIPDYLWPQRSPLGLDDLRVAPSTAELRVIAKVLDHDHIAGQAMVTMRDGSPWLEFDVFVPFHGEARAYVLPETLLPAPSDAPPELAPPGIYRYAIWRYTARAYRCDKHGAVEDDPIDL